MDISIDILGEEKIIATLDRLDDQLPHELERAVRMATTYVHASLPGYPPARADSSYTRTGTLGREITTEVRDLGGTIVGAIGTNTVYAPWVISSQKTSSGRGPQAWMHYRWWTLQQVLADKSDMVTSILKSAIGKVIDGI